ncbi:MAG: cytochrome c biogenesis protein CcsA [Opitutales bacterium]
MTGNTPLHLLQAAVALYVLGFGYALAVTVRGREHHRPVFYALIIAGFAAQSTGLYLRGLETHSFPVANTFELLQALAWVTIFLKLILRATLRLRLLGLFASGLAALLGLASLFMPGANLPPVGVASAGDPWIGFHVALALFSYGVFGLLAVTALMYLIQRYGLEHKRFSGIFRLLPSLAELDALNRQLLLVGVWALSVAVILGALDWLGQPGGVSAGKLTVVIAVWIGYLAVGWLRWRNRLVAGAYAWTCVLLFAFAMFSLWPVSRNDRNPPLSPTSTVNK